MVRFVDGVRMSRTSLYDEVTSRIADATVAALLIAKASLATERGVDLRLDPDSRVGKVYGALSRDLTTVVGNLVDNALDAAASAEQPRVDVRVIDHGDAIVVSVSDNGPGVSDPEVVFRQGYTTKGHGVGSVDGGRGFGLALTRLVCRRRGGDVTVHNDEGAVFTANLPTSRGGDQGSEASG